MTPILAIDPGADGGLALLCAEGIVSAWKMPDGMTAQVDGLRELSANHRGLRCVLERVGGYMPGNSGPGAAKFARHCGNLEAALYALGIPTAQVAPKAWQKGMNLPSEKPLRKRAIKEQMAAMYPHLAVTLATADALGILSWAINNNQEDSKCK